MPQLDKPLAELKRYKGINPRPTTFDSYWKKALAELNQTDPKARITPSKTVSSQFADCFDLVFQGVRGADVYAKLIVPKQRKNKLPAILHFHGYSCNSGDWYDKLPYAAEGFVIAAMDCRGQGGKSSDPGGVLGNTLKGHIIRGLDDPDPHSLYYRNVFLDTAMLARVVMALPYVDPTRLGAMGGSQGGALTLACAALEPRIKKIAPIYPFLCDYQRVWQMDLAKHAYQEIQDYFKRFDPRHEREAQMWAKLGHIDCQHLAPRIKAEVLFFTGLMDEVCPPSTQFAAYNKITSKKKMVLYPDFGHETLPGAADLTFNFMRTL